MHQTGDFAELVCSNSFRADDWTGNAVGLLHAEMRRCGSLILAAADAHQVPAGGALAVDREGFSRAVTQRLRAHPNATVVEAALDGWPPEAWGATIVATGPLTSPALAGAILQRTGEDALAFFDAIAPIVHADSLDMTVCWKQSRYDKAGPGGDAAAYVNCPMDQAQYEAFIDALLAGPTTAFKPFETEHALFRRLPADRGDGRARARDPAPRTDEAGWAHQCARAGCEALRPWCNSARTMRSARSSTSSASRTKLKHAAQAETLRMIPGLQNAVFARLGGVHRNTFLNSPRLLDGLLRLKTDPRIRFAGQITGVEGYVESAATGLLAGRFAVAEAQGAAAQAPPAETALGALLGHVTGGHLEGAKGSFQPMNINYGLLPPLQTPFAKRDAAGRRLSANEKSRAKKRALGERALQALDGWLGDPPVAVAAE